MPPKPWEKNPPKPRKVSGPLIPGSKISTPTQRLIITAAFWLLQGYKFAGDKTLVRFVAFTALDAAFLAYLPVLGIPKLNFKRKVTLFFIACLVLVNYAAFVDASWPLLLLWVLTRPLMWLIRSKGTDISTGYIQGKYVVDILPEASASLDAISPLCIEPGRDESVFLRLTVDNAWPSYVSLSRATLGNTSEYENIEFSKQKLLSQPKEKNRLYVPISKPGAYYLNAIRDEKTGMRVRVDRKRVVVPPCPSVEVRSLSAPQICKNAILQAEIVGHGVTPLKLKIDGKMYSLGEAQKEDGVQEFTYVVDKIGVANSAKVEVEAVGDALGTRSKYSKVLTVSAQVLTPAVASFARETRIPRIDAVADAYIDVSGDKLDLPFKAVLQLPDGNHEELVLPSLGQHKFSVSQLGKYRLLSLEGAKCAGSAHGEIEVFEPPQLSVDVGFEVVQDKCAGPSGVNARLKLTGTAPFKVKYRMSKMNRVLNQKEDVFADYEKIIEFKPRDVGEYLYEIVSVTDKYRTIEPQLSTTQKITELPGAAFGKISSTKLCGQTQVNAEVLIRGRGPFTLRYRIDDESRYEVATHDTTDRARLDLAIDLPTRGAHFIRLDSLVDRNGCVTDLGGVRSPTINVYPDLAKIAFQNAGTIKSAEPVDLKIALQSRDLSFPASLVYEHELDGEKARQQVLLQTAEESFIRATKPGDYRLISLNDGICGGEVDSDEVVSISLYERPAIQVDKVTHGFCLGSESEKLHAQLVGEPPFKVIHEVLDPQNESQMKTLEVESNVAEFSLDCDFVGEYKHFFWILDQRYPDLYRNKFVTAKHTVLAPAEASFVQAKQSLGICENTGTAARLPMTLKGTAPLTLDVEVNGGPVEQRVVNDLSQYELELQKQLRVGSNRVKIVGVHDGNGCSSPYRPLHDEAKIEVFSAPVKPSIKKTDFCIGEKVSFPVHGRSGSQLSVVYESGGKTRTEKINDNHFERYVNTPGQLKVFKVEDDRGCSVDADIAVRVHPLPSSTITASPHFSIYEGDQVSLGFAFEGTAPFSFVYTRSVNGKVKERKTVSNIMENVYTIIVDQGGEYEITELRDKFCKSHR